MSVAIKPHIPLVGQLLTGVVVLDYEFRQTRPHTVR